MVSGAPSVTRPPIQHLPPGCSGHGPECDLGLGLEPLEPPGQEALRGSLVFLWPSRPTWDWALGPGPTVSSRPYLDLLLVDLTVANPKSSKMQDPRLPSLAQPGVQPHKGPHWLPPCEDPLRTRRVPSRVSASTGTACCRAGPLGLGALNPQLSPQPRGFWRPRR